jgi:hypothetical protein
MLEVRGWFPGVFNPAKDGYVSEDFHSDLVLTDAFTEQWNQLLTRSSSDPEDIITILAMTLYTCLCGSPGYSITSAPQVHHL